MPTLLEAKQQQHDAKSSITTAETRLMNYTELIVPLVVALGKVKQSKKPLQVIGETNKLIKIQPAYASADSEWKFCYSRCPIQSCLDVCNAGKADHDGSHYCKNGHYW